MRKNLLRHAGVKIGSLAVIMLMILISLTAIFVIMPEAVKAAPDTEWYDGDWKNRIPVNLSTASASTVANYQVLLNISHETGMQADFDDLRFVNYSDHTDVWSSWLEYKVDSSYAFVWVKVGESITASNQTMMYMYYNNSSASSGWDGENTFNWFEPYITNVTASPGYNWDNDTSEYGAIFNESFGFNAIDGYRLRTKLEISDWDAHADNPPLFAFGLTNSSTLEGYANAPACGFYITLYPKTIYGADATHLAYKPTIYNTSSQGSPTYTNPVFAEGVSYIFDFNMTTTSLGIRLLYPNNGSAVENGTTILSGVTQQNDDFSWIFFHMATDFDHFKWDDDSNLSIKMHKLGNYMEMNITWSFVGHWQSDEPISYFGEVEQGDVSTFILNGLEGSNNNITWAGVAGTTVWSNATGAGGGTGGTMEAYMVINTTDNVTVIRVLCGDINVTQGIVIENITLYISSDNSSFGSLGAYADRGDGKGNKSINSSNWNAGTMGANPFSGAGLTNKTDSIYCRFTLAIPAGATSGTYSVSDWKVYFGHY